MLRITDTLEENQPVSYGFPSQRASDAESVYNLWCHNSLFGDVGATHADLMEAAQSFVCVSIGIHGRWLTPTIHV